MRTLEQKRKAASGQCFVDYGFWGGVVEENQDHIEPLAEAGVPGAEITTWYGLFTTGGTPRPIVERLHAELGRALALADVRARLTGLGGEPGALGVREFSEMNRAEYERYGRLIREAGIKID